MRIFSADCDLLESAGQRNAAAHGGGGDFCGQISNLRFGQPVLTGNYDPDVLSGWGVRAGDWSLGLSVQQQLLARMSIEVGYYRRSFDGFTLNDNLALASGRSTTPTASPRRRIHGCPTAAATPIGNLYDVDPSAVRSGRQARDARREIRQASTRYFNGLDVTLSLRTRTG